MSNTQYPYGYGRSTCTLMELKSRFSGRMHPAYARRLFAWIEAKGGNIGIGGGWRSTQPALPGFAPEGKSFHQDQRFSSGFIGYSAVDLVAKNGSNVHRAPRWDEVPKQGSGHPDIDTFGVHANVNGEPWHLQPMEIDGWQSWVNRGRPDPVLNYPLPTGPSTPPPVDPETPPTGWPPVDLENGVYGLYPLDTNKRTVQKGSTDTPGGQVSYLQAVLRNECGMSMAVDGHFGNETYNRVRQMQGWNGLAQDGICGPKTWRVVDIYASR